MGSCGLLSGSLLYLLRISLTRYSCFCFYLLNYEIWNSMPDPVTSAPSVAVFRSRLKTHPFNISYPSPLWLYSACTVTVSCFGHYNRSSFLPSLLILQYKTKIKDVHELRQRIVDEWDKLNQRIIDKAVEEWQKRLVQLAWSQEEDSFNIRCEHFSLLTFCHVLFLKYRLFDNVCWLIKMHVMCHCCLSCPDAARLYYKVTK